MALNVGSLYAELTLDISKFSAGIGQATELVQNLGAQLQAALGTNTAQSFTTLNRRLGNFMKRTTEVQDTIKNLKQTVADLTGSTAFGFNEIGEQAAKSAENISKISNSLKTVETNLTSLQNQFTGMNEYLNSVVESARVATKELNNIVPNVQGAAKQTKNFSNAMNGASSSVRNTNSQIRKLRNQVFYFGKDIKRIVGGIIVSQMFYRTVNAIQDTVDSVIEFKNNMRQAAISFEYFLGSREAAELFIEMMKDFAAITPFTVEQALNMSKRLMSAGFDPRYVKDIMTILTDAAAAVSKDASEMDQRLDRIILALTQIKTYGYLAGQEIRQLAEANIPVYQILREELGLSAEQMQNIGKLKIPAEVGIAAILRGLQRYRGAAERFANEVPGMISTIKESLLIIADELFEGIYERYRGFIKNIRDRLNDLRQALREGGIGGFFERLFPPSVHQALRSIIGMFQALGQTIKNVWKLIVPFVSSIVQALVKFLGIIAPVVAGVFNLINWLFRLARQAYETSPFIQALAKVLSSLLIAVTVGRILIWFWGVVKLGAICAAVAQAVISLAKAIQYLYLAFTKNPLVGIIMLVAGALLSLALSSKTVSAWLDNLTRKLAGLAGVNVDEILVFHEQGNIEEFLEEFNKQLDDMKDSFKGIGNEASKAGKKIKDKFLAPFDEVYQVPENLDKVSDGLESLGDDFAAWGIPDLRLPDLGKLITQTSGIGGGFSFRDFEWPTFDLPQAPPPPPGRGRGQTPTAVVTAEVATVNSLIASMLRNWDALLPELSAKVKNELVPVLAEANKAVEDFFVKEIPRALSIAGQKMGEWIENFFVKGIPKALGTVGQKIGEWVDETISSFKRWGKAAWDPIYNWGVNAANSISTWYANTKNQVIDWVTSTKENFVSWGSNTLTNIRNWATNTATNFNNWITTTRNNFNTWSSAIRNSIGIWAVNSAKNIGTWVTATANDIYNWCVSTATNFVNWVNSCIKNAGTFAKNASQNIASFVNNTSSNLGKWAQNVAKNSVEAFNTMGQAIVNFCSGSWTTFTSWLSGTSSRVYSWARTVTNNLIAWAQSAWQTIKNLAASVGQALGVSFKKATASLSNAAITVGSWINANKKWIVPTLLGAAVVGAGIAAVATGGATLPVFSKLAAASALAISGFERGGVIDTEQLIRVGERNHREVIIPTEVRHYMAPFADAVADRLIERILKNTNTSTTSVEERPILYVGTLIADDRSLAELARRMEIVYLREGGRR